MKDMKVKSKVFQILRLRRVKSPHKDYRIGKMLGRCKYHRGSRHINFQSCDPGLKPDGYVTVIV